jgi:Na+-transporting NADH:ubiquinone oxidoreductase subunit B
MMRALRSFLDAQARHFQPGGRLRAFYPLYEAIDTFAFSPGHVTTGSVHVRDGLDLKRMMGIVVAALLPTVVMACYNVGLQAHRAIAAGAQPLDAWQTRAFQALGFGFTLDPLACLVHGALFLLPVMAVTFAAGGTVEVLFAVVRKHEVNEGFFVTGFLLPLTLPPTIPLWQVALGTAVGILIGKEVFGGTGMNVLNPALTCRALLFFAYPAEISGDKPWIAADFAGVDGFSGATWLSRAASEGVAALGDLGSPVWFDAFLGKIPGSMGETSTLLCLLGAAVLVATQIGSWRTMLGVTIGSFLAATSLNLIGSETNPMFSVPFLWHVVLGGWAFGTVFMATDPVSSAFTEKGKLWYGFGIGMLVILVRVVNPAYPEGMMLAILFMNMFAPLIDHFYVQANIKRRRARHAAR